MGVLCFGSYATLLKEAMGNPADSKLVPLLFGAIEKSLGDLDNGDCQKWRSSKSKLPTYIVNPIDTPAVMRTVENYFALEIMPLIKESKKTKLYQSLYSLLLSNTYIDTQLKYDIESSLLNKNYAYFASQIFLLAVAQPNVVSDPLSDVELLPLPKEPTFETTMLDSGFERVFIPVTHSEIFTLKNKSFVKLFRFDISNCSFSLNNFSDFLEKNIGRYVFSRAKRERLIADGHIESIGKKAVELIKKAGGFDNAKIGEELGDIILYALLEQNLLAPKLYNKIELVETSGVVAVNQGGVHLLALDDMGTSFQIVVAKSNIVGDLRTAIDNAFSAIIPVEKNISNEYNLLDSSVLGLSFAPHIAEHLRNIVIPTKRKQNLDVQNAFGVFLGYSIGLDRAKHAAAEFTQAVEAKMVEDIKSQIAYISSRITSENLSGYSFYFYFIPFNDADCEKVVLMQSLVGGSI